MKDRKAHADYREISEKCNVYFEEQRGAFTTTTKKMMIISILYIIIVCCRFGLKLNSNYKTENVSLSTE